MSEDNGAKSRRTEGKLGKSGKMSGIRGKLGKSAGRSGERKPRGRRWRLHRQSRVLRWRMSGGCFTAGGEWPPVLCRFDSGNIERERERERRRIDMGADWTKNEAEKRNGEEARAAQKQGRENTEEFERSAFSRACGAERGHVIDRPVAISRAGTTRGDPVLFSHLRSPAEPGSTR